MITDRASAPTDEARRHAVAAALSAAPGLVRYAARFTHSLDDAEDAYQRAMEIALTKAPVTEQDALIGWLHTVIRRIALEIVADRNRVTPLSDDELDASVDECTARHAPSAQAVVEWKERYRVIQDALGSLTDSQRVCLMLMTSGVTVDEIGAATGFTTRKVERSIAEGRDRLRTWEQRISTGMECERFTPLIERVTENLASRGERGSLSRHVRHCAHCRAAYRGRREQLRVMAALVPAALIAPDLAAVRPPDPSLALTWWERVSGSANMRAVQTMQVMMDLPALATSKAGASAIAAAAAGTLSAPFVIDAVRPAPPPVKPVATAVVNQTVTPLAAPIATPKATAAPKQPRAATRSVPAKASKRAAPATTGVRATPRSQVRSTTYRPSTTQLKAPVAPRKSSPALEFGP